MKQYKSLLFDLDDTILRCGKYYHACKNEFIQYQHARTGISPHIIEKILDGIDIACTELEGGFLKERFPRSFAAVSSVLDTILGRMVDQNAKNTSYQIGNSVFDAPYELINGAYETLKLYKDAGYRMFLYTKGDEKIQRRKLDKNGLYAIFNDEKDIHIVPKKNSEYVIEHILEANGLDKNETILIGDSLKDDIGSAGGSGIDSVLINADKPVWYLDVGMYVPTHVRNSIKDLPTIIPV